MSNSGIKSWYKTVSKVTTEQLEKAKQSIVGKVQPPPVKFI